MAKTVVALYDDVGDAQTTVRELIDHGVSRDRISLVASNPDQPGEALRSHPGQESAPVSQPAPREGEPGNVDSEAKAGAGIGAVLGGIGGLLVGLGALAIPGIGPVLAAGPLAAALGGVAGAGTGAIAGAAAGGLVGALSDMGVNEENAGYYAEGIRRGGILVTVQTDNDDVDPARTVMNQHHPVDINERGTQWRQSGWSGFQPGQQPGTRVGNQPEATYRDDETPEKKTQNEFLESVYEKRDIDTGGMRAGGVPDYSRYDDEFRSHFQRVYTGRGLSYDRFTPAYQYGMTVASMEGFQGSEWGQVEPQARRQWEMDHPDTPWEEIKGAVHHAWSRLQHPDV